MLKIRYSEIISNDYIKYVQIFKNCGPDAGASIMHSHWQIIGVPIIPSEQMNIAESISRHKKESGKCILCSIMEHEMENKTRVVMENDNFIAVAPYASKMSYECDIIPKEHISRFSEFDDEKLMPVSYTHLRSDAKAVNFGIIYGMGAFSLAKDLGITKKMAEDYIKGYFAKYPNIKKYMDKTVEDAAVNGYVSTIYGRRRPVPEINSGNFNRRAFGERVAMNMPIQGSAADIIKIAMRCV